MTNAMRSLSFAAWLIAACGAAAPPPAGEPSGAERSAEAASNGEATCAEPVDAGTWGGPLTPRPGIVRMSGGIVDVEAGVGYVARADEPGIEAVDLRFGRPNWATDAGAVPLDLFEEALLVQASPQLGCLELVLLDLVDGHAFAGWRIPLPSDVLPTDDQRTGHVFSMVLRGADARLALWWEHRPYQCSGIQQVGADAFGSHGHIEIEPGRAVRLTVGEEPSLVPPPFGAWAEEAHLGDTVVRSAGAYLTEWGRAGDTLNRPVATWSAARGEVDLWEYPVATRVWVLCTAP